MGNTQPATAYLTRRHVRTRTPTEVAMLPEKIARGVSEVRRDLGSSDQGRLRAGVLITLATVLVVASGWPPGDGLQRGIFLVMGALPLAALGTGLAVGEVMHARADRRGEDEADERELEILRAHIATETGRPAVAAPSRTVASACAPEVPRPLMQNAGPLVTRRCSSGFRSGHLRLR